MYKEFITQISLPSDVRIQQIAIQFRQRGESIATRLI